jgi:DNA-binding NarL/FixJ family response regulator
VPKTSVLLADDNSAVLDHVNKLLKKTTRYQVVAAFCNGAAVLREYKRISPDVIVLDISMDLLSGIDVAQHLRDRGCNSKIIFLTVHEDSDYITAAIGAGGSAYVVKSRLSTDLIPAINAALSHKIFVSPTLLYTL